MVLNFKGLDYETQWVEYPDIAPLLRGLYVFFDHFTESHVSHTNSVALNRTKTATHIHYLQFDF